MKLYVSLFASLALALGGACRSAERSTAAPFAAPFPAMAAENADGAVAVEARHYTDHKRVFGVDLPREARVLPVALKLGLAPGASHSLRFDPARAALRLYLPDGTVVASKPAAAIQTQFKRANERIVATALDARVLAPWSAAREANVYFDLGEAGELFVKRGEISRRVGEEVRTFGLEQALIGFELEVDGAPRSVFVGLAPTNGARYP